LETLAKLKPAFRKNGTTTAGNSSQVTDGAAAVVLARRSVAEKLGLPILARFVQYAVKGCPPELMGIGPAVAIPELLKKTGMKVSDIDIWEINEAFASQATYSIEKLGISKDKLNPKGGALALGHPLGCTGTFKLIFRFKTNRHLVTRIVKTKQAIRSCLNVYWNRYGSRRINRERMISWLLSIILRERFCLIFYFLRRI
jgi:acetyl-CoA acetyltransferase family protein